MNISGDAPFHEILKQVNGLTIPESPHDDEHTRYAMLELINNSLRAHREKGIKNSILTRAEDLIFPISHMISTNRLTKLTPTAAVFRYTEKKISTKNLEWD